MNNIEQIKAKIERLKEKYRPLIYSEDSEKSKEGGYKIEALNELMLSLPEEQPSEDLEQEVKRFLESEESTAYENAGSYKVAVKDPVKIARHFYELGLNTRKEE